MLRTNLSTRPFYNVRAVAAVLGSLALVVFTFTVINVVALVRLTSAQSTLGASAAQAEAEAVRLRGEATRIRGQIDQEELAVVSAAAREANRIIDQRAFSWTNLFSQFEMTLPEDVRIRSVTPRLERDQIIVAVAIEARRAEDVDAFVEALEQAGAFNDVLPLVVETTEEGLLAGIVEATYTVAAPPAPAAEAAR
jgi:hypothetical protein